MKATLLKAVVLVTLVFSSISGANATEKMVYNDTMDGDLVVSTTVYIGEEYLKNYRKYDYTYDNESRVIAREAFKWNERTGKWVSSHKVSFTYENENIIIELAKWNKKDNAYNIKVGRSIMEFNEVNTPVAYKGYKWNESAKDWKLAQDVEYRGIDNLLVEK